MSAGTSSFRFAESDRNEVQLARSRNSGIKRFTAAAWRIGSAGSIRTHLPGAIESTPILGAETFGIQRAENAAAPEDGRTPFQGSAHYLQSHLRLPFVGVFQPLSKPFCQTIQSGRAIQRVQLHF